MKYTCTAEKVEIKVGQTIEAVTSSDECWVEKTDLGTLTCSKDERIDQRPRTYANCLADAEYLGAPYVYWQSADERPVHDTPACHIYSSCENTRVPAETGVNMKNTCTAVETSSSSLSLVGEAINADTIVLGFALIGLASSVYFIISFVSNRTKRDYVDIEITEC